MVQYASTNREQKRRREEEEKEEAVKKLRGRNKASRRPTSTGKGIPTGPTGRNKLRQSRKDELNLKRSQTKYEDGQTDTVKKAVAGKTPSAKKVLEKVLKKTTAPRMTGAAPTNPKEQARLKAIAGKQKAMPKNRSISDRLNRKMSQTKYKDGQTDIVKEAVSPIKKARGITNPAVSSMLPIPKKRSRMEQDQDMITGIGERAAAANKKPTTSRNITNPAVSSMIPSRKSAINTSSVDNKKPTTGTRKAPYIPPLYPDAEGEAFAKSTRKNYANKGKAAAPTATGPAWKQYKSIAAAKAAEPPSKYYMGKDGKKKAALFKEDLDKSLSRRDAYNKALGLKRADGSAVEKAKPNTEAKAKKKKSTTEGKSFRQRRLERLKKRAANEDTSEGRKRRLKRRIGRVEGRIEDNKKKEAKKKPKKVMGGGMVTAKKPYKHGGEVKGYAVGGMKKMRGAGIESKGTRPCQMR